MLGDGMEVSVSLRDQAHKPSLLYEKGHVLENEPDVSLFKSGDYNGTNLQISQLMLINVLKILPMIAISTSMMKVLIHRQTLLRACSYVSCHMLVNILNDLVIIFILDFHAKMYV